MRLIDADALLAQLTERAENGDTNWRQIQYDIEDAPTVPAMVWHDATKEVPSLDDVRGNNFIVADTNGYRCCTDYEFGHFCYYDENTGGWYDVNPDYLEWWAVIPEPPEVDACD